MIKIEKLFYISLVEYCMENIITIIYVKFLIFINVSYNIIAEFFKNTMRPKKSVLIPVTKPDPPTKLRRTNSSLEHLCQYDHYEKLEQPLILNVKLSLQSRNNCERCGLKLYHNQKRYFAFDREYCYNCWSKLSTKIVNTHS